MVGVKTKTVGYFLQDAPTPTTSPPSQTAHQKEFLALTQRLGYEPAATFVDMAGGNNVARIEYKRMIDYIRSNKGSYLVVITDLDSLPPGTADTIFSLMELEEWGAKLHIMRSGQTMEPLQAALDEWSRPSQSKEARERIKTGMKHKAMKGEGLGKPPYGYRIGPARRLETHHSEAEAVQLIFRLYTEQKMGMRLIARYLNEHAVPTRRGGKWSMVTIRDILKNRVYLGTYSRFGMKVPGSHPALITPDLFRLAETKRERLKPTRHGRGAKPFLLSGLVWCGYCNNKMVGVTRRQSWTRSKDSSRTTKDYRYYQCQSRTNQSVCQYHTKRAEALEEAVASQMTQRWQSLQPPTTAGQEPEAAPSKEPATEAATQQLEKRLRQYLEQVAGGKMSYQRFRSLGGTLLKARRKLDAGPVGSVPKGYQVAALSHLAKDWATLDFAARKALIQEVLDKVVSFDDRIELHFRGE